MIQHLIIFLSLHYKISCRTSSSSEDENSQKISLLINFPILKELPNFSLKQPFTMHVYSLITLVATASLCYISSGTPLNNNVSPTLESAELVGRQVGACVNGQCAAGLCCSPFGYCGTGPGTEPHLSTLPSPQLSVSSKSPSSNTNSYCRLLRSWSLHRRHRRNLRWRPLLVITLSSQLHRLETDDPSSKYGYCGTGPAYCAGCGTGPACATGLCCSQWGFW